MKKGEFRAGEKRIEDRKERERGRIEKKTLEMTELQTEEGTERVIEWGEQKRRTGEKIEWRR